MCYYATTDYACGDWKWGNMMERCPRQHRIGETCGAKLVHHESVTRSDKVCRICEEIQVKQRRLTRVAENISRWSTESDRFKASLEKAQREARELQEKIKDLNSRRSSMVLKVNAQSPSAGGGYEGGGLPSLGVNVGSGGGYTYTSSATPGYVSGQTASAYSTTNTGSIQGRPASGYTGSPASPQNSRHTVAYSQYQNQNQNRR